MKRKLDLFDPRQIIGLGIICFIIALINSLMVGAYSMSDLDLWGQIFGYGVIGSIAWFFIVTLIIPIFSNNRLIIKKGKHSAKGINIGFTFKNNIAFTASFSPSCLYNIEGVDKYDINKLYGFSTTHNHHIQSARVGWRCIDGENIQLLTYSYNNSLRALEDTNILGEVKPNEIFDCEIIDKEDYYEYKFQKGGRKNNNIVVAKDKKQKDWFLFHYILFPYFGGNNPAPHDMKIYIKKH